MVLHAVAALVIGHSAGGLPIRAYEVGNPASPEKVLVVGCIHGDEPAGIPVVWKLARMHPSFDLWLVPMANLDGCTRDVHQNAHGVDLNRNYPSNWARLGHPGTYAYSGPHAQSEPETKALIAFIRRIKPRISIWYHQHQNIVRAWGQSIPSARRYARLSGMRFAAIRWPYGTAANWQNHAFPGTSSFVVELPAGSLTSTQVTRLARAVLSLAS
jgi:murein peptide amidase A